MAPDATANTMMLSEFAEALGKLMLSLYTENIRADFGGFMHTGLSEVFDAAMMLSPEEAAEKIQRLKLEAPLPTHQEERAIVKAVMELADRAASWESVQRLVGNQ